MSDQMDMFRSSGVAVAPPPPVDRISIRLGNREAKPPLARMRREALKAFVELLEELVGRDIYIGTCGGSHSHFWLSDLKLGKLRVELFGTEYPVIVLRGKPHDAEVRIFTEQVYSLRRQDHIKGCTLYYLDFWNGFPEYPRDKYRPPGYVSLHIHVYNK